MEDDFELWLDQNFSPIIAKWLKEETGWKAKSTFILGLNNQSDEIIFNTARQRGNVIILSKDADFAELINRKGSPPKLVNIRIGNCKN